MYQIHSVYDLLSEVAACHLDVGKKVQLRALYLLWFQLVFGLTDSNN
jgi:hypothetical protein